MKNNTVPYLFLMLLMGALTSTPQAFSGSKISKSLSARSSLDQELFQEIANGNTERVAAIFTQDPSLVNMHSYFGDTLLMLATQSGHIEIVDRLMSAGVNIDAQNQRGITALIIAAQCVQPEIVDRLIAHGATVGIKDETGWTAFMWAIDRGSEIIVDKLITAGVDVNTLHKYGQTALMHAAHHGYSEIVKKLLDARAEITLENSMGQTALKIARQKGHTAIVELIESYVPRETEEETIMVKPAV